MSMFFLRFLTDMGKGPLKKKSFEPIEYEATREDDNWSVKPAKIYPGNFFNGMNFVIKVL
jgi:hypothetical protein